MLLGKGGRERDECGERIGGGISNSYNDRWVGILFILGDYRSQVRAKVHILSRKQLHLSTALGDTKVTLTKKCLVIVVVFRGEHSAEALQQPILGEHWCTTVHRGKYSLFATELTSLIHTSRGLGIRHSVSVVISFA